MNKRNIAYVGMGYKGRIAPCGNGYRAHILLTCQDPKMTGSPTVGLAPMAMEDSQPRNPICTLLGAKS
jgi:hypothetical protein